MSTVKYPLVGGRSMRLTNVDSCGRPVFGNASHVVSDGFVTIAVTANYDDGTEVAVTNAAGDKCVQRDARAELTNLGIAATFCGVDPDLYSGWTGQPKIIDPATGEVIGFDVDSSIRPSDVYRALEVWSDAQGAGGCGDDDDVPYGYLLWPFLSGARVGDYTIENGAVTFQITGAVTKKGSQWGEGPYVVQTDSAGDPDVLQDPVKATTHQRVFRTTVPPPEVTNGYVPMDDPDSPAATTATAGTPGTFNGVRPLDLAALRASSITGSGGASPWTTGQYVILGDGSRAHWLGSGANPKWAAGRKP